MSERSDALTSQDWTPLEIDDQSPSPNGEAPDKGTMDMLRLCLDITNRHPMLKEQFIQHRGQVAIVSTALLLMVGRAVAQRINKGEEQEEILRSITPGEILRAARVEFRRNQLKFNNLKKRIQRQINRKAKIPVSGILLVI